MTTDRERAVADVLATALERWACLDDDIIVGWLDRGGECAFLADALVRANCISTDQPAGQGRPVPVNVTDMDVDACWYSPVEWAKWPGVDGPVLICLNHMFPAPGAVYDANFDDKTAIYADPAWNCGTTRHARDQHVNERYSPI